MAYTTDNREHDLLEWQAEVEAQIRALDRLSATAKNIDTVDNDIAGQGTGSVVKKSQKKEQLMETLAYIEAELAKLVYDEVRQVAIGCDTIGTNIGETIS